MYAYFQKYAGETCKMVLKEKDTPRRIGLSVVESAANTFTAQLILLPNSKGESVFDLDKVQLALNPATPAAVDDYGSYRVQIQKDTGTTPAAILGQNDSRVLYDGQVSIASGTEAADFTMIDRHLIGESHEGYAEYIANDQFWLVIQGTAMAAAVTVQGWAIGSVETLTIVQITALLVAQLD